jgi:hypothetical protein
LAQARPAEPARLVVGGLSSFPDAWAEARRELEALFGPVDLDAGPLPFGFTDYYAAEMGAGLQRWLASFSRLVGQHAISGIKGTTNRIESELAAAGRWPAARPVNLDPGYVTLGKLVLASTKDQVHRIAVSPDIYAEVTLRFVGGRFVPCDWTYADYRQEQYLEFFGRVREALRAELRRGAGRAG